ncbi:MAG: hypothetical protein A2Y38_09555 [Spirochaetes bacterium GWB1_59_5]|nr:MAG: hypothetical protein A2Y38_09555 [Spirochaetes bacterium GWB1_59_5]
MKKDRQSVSTSTAARIFTVMLLAGIALATGCSVSPPEFMSIGAHLVVVAVDAEGGKDERLSLFASVSDKDGVDDIEYLYVVHEGEELSWTLTRDDWQRSEEGSSIWLGSNSLDAPGSVMPRGQYRVILVDKAGERTERAISLNAPETSLYKVPALSVSGMNVVLDSDYSVNTVFFFDSGGNVVLTAAIFTGTSLLDALWPKGQWRSGSDYIAVYGFDPKAETGFFSWKIRLPD